MMQGTGVNYSYHSLFDKKKYDKFGKSTNKEKSGSFMRT